MSNKLAELSQQINNVLLNDDIFNTSIFQHIYHLTYLLVEQNLGNEVYHELENCISNYVTSLNNQFLKEYQQHHDSILLKFNELYDIFKHKMMCLKNSLLFLDVEFCALNEITPILYLANKIFHQIIFNKAFLSLYQDSLINIIRNERVNNIFDPTFSQQLNIIHQLDLKPYFIQLKNIKKYNESNPYNKSCINYNHHVLYEEIFESIYLKETRIYFQAKNYMNFNQISDYLTYVDHLICIETPRIKRLPTNSQNKVYDIIHDETIAKNSHNLLKNQSGLAYLIEQKQYEFLKLLYKLFSYNFKSKNILAHFYSSYYLSKLNEILLIKNSYKLIHQFIYRIEESLFILNECFNNDDLFTNNFYETLKSIISPINDSFILHLCCYFNTYLLNLYNTTSTFHLNQLIMNHIFTLLNNKQLFYLYYEKYLFKRILNHYKSLSDVNLNYEFQLLELLMNIKGEPSCIKFLSILNDLKSSQNIIKTLIYEDIMTRIEQYSSIFITPIHYDALLNNNTNDITCLSECNEQLILNSTINQLRNHVIHNLTSSYPNLAIDYKKKYGTVILSLTLNHKNIDIISNLSFSSIILLFNKKDCFTMEEIYQQTNIHLLKDHLELLINKQILKQINSNQYMLNNEFQLKTKTINLISSLSINNHDNDDEEKEENSLINQQIDKNNLFSNDAKIDSIIVYLMKTNKKYQHDQLFNDVQNHLYFKINLNKFKERIEILIEKDYILRNNQDRNLYEYIF